MTRLLYWDNTNIALRRMTDTQLERIIYFLQFAYANQLNNGGGGSFSVTGSSSNAGSAQDTARTRRSGVSNFPGTGTQVVTTTFYHFNVQNPGASNTSDAPLYWTGSALQRSNTTSLATELFTQARNNIRTGNELGSYRLQVSNPGTGWTSKGTAFVDRVYNGGVGQGFSNSVGVNTTYTLYLKTGGVTAPGASNEGTPVFFNDTDIQISQLTSHTSAVVNYLLPLFTAWANDNGLFWQVQTSPSGHNRNSFIDTRLSSSQNNQFNLDSYVSTPVGSPTTHEIYYFNAT